MTEHKWRYLKEGEQVHFYSREKVCDRCGCIFGPNGLMYHPAIITEESRPNSWVLGGDDCDVELARAVTLQ